MNRPMGGLFRGILNDLKRRPEDAARELGISEKEIVAYLESDLPLPATLIETACMVWPVSPRDFAIVYDDCPTGVKLMTAEQSQATARIMDRKGSPYYEYRDTAASRVSSFRPEWIKELLDVNDNEPSNSHVQWNNGHFMHQFTYFIGPVNFYYKDRDDCKRVAVMNTGDSMYIRPFVPHTFATRAKEKKQQGAGIILALTYGGGLVGDVQQELQAVSADLANNYALDYSSPAAATASMIDYFMKALSMPVEELVLRTGLPPLRLSGILQGRGNQTHGNFYGDIRAIARALNVNVRDLIVQDENTNSVVVTKFAEQNTWNLATEGGNYRVTELASTPAMPLSKSLHFLIDQSDCKDYGLKFGLHQYLYNTGKTDVLMEWKHLGQTFSQVIKPNDSAFVKPFIPHCFNANGGELISLRIPSHVGGEAIREISSIGREHTPRMVNEQIQWFNKSGKS